MGRIQSSVGLVTGIKIQETVDQLIALQAQPRDTLVARNKLLGAQQAAVTDLTALTLGVQFAARRLANLDLFGQKNVASSAADLLTATAGTTATAGQYQFVPARLAQSHQVIASGVAARDQALGGGSLTFRFGGHVDPGASLADLNAGEGLSRGKIKITDRNGESAIIDLRFAQSIDDVLAAINSADEIEVEAAAVGDRLVLRDSSGGVGNLKVQEVSGGTTAADLGLAAINVAANEATGQDIVELFSGHALDQLRDGAGLSLRAELPDLNVSLRDGTSLEIDFNPADEDPPRTLGDLLDQINAADPVKLEARISADGKRIELQDLTAGSDPFTVGSPLGGSLAEELGLTGAAVGDTITGGRLISGLKTTLLGSLSGGRGLGTLGALTLTDRSGASATVDLASAESLDDVIDAINDASLGITASYNSARNGLVLTDTTGLTASNLIAADGDATNTATKLGLAASVAADSLNSGTLNRQVVSHNTLLSTYKAGGAVSLGSFLITDSAGQNGAVNLKVLAPETIGDVIDAINALSIGVEARINDAGDGIALIDTAGGSGTLTVGDVGSGRSAADLKIVGNGEATIIGGQPAQIIDGSTTITIDLEADETLDDLVEKINAADGGATANVLSESSGSLRHHLSLLSSIAGRAGELLIDGTGLGLSFADLATAQDALLQVGGSVTGILRSGTSNVFEDVLPGIDVTLHNASTDTVTVTVSQTAEGVAGAVQTFVDNYNKLRDKLDTYTAFNPEAGTKGTLFASAETLRIDAELSRLVTGRYVNDSDIRSLAELGVTINDQGQLAFDRTKLDARFATDPEGVTEFFADDERGFAAQADDLIERLVGRDNSLLVNRAQTIQRQIDDQAERIDRWTARLERSRERMLLEFFRLEETISRLQNNLSAIQQIQFIGPIQGSSS
jgi:flagellar hook-associated protein 2